MKKLIANLFLAIALTFSLSTFAPAQISIKSYINTAGAGKCVDIADGVLRDPYYSVGGWIVQFDCHNGINQQFFIERLDNGYSLIRSPMSRDWCLGIDSMYRNTNPTSGVPVGMYKCLNRPQGVVQYNVLWKIHPLVANQVYRFEHLLKAAAGDVLCLDIPYATANNSQRLQVHTCHYGGNQSWTFIPQH